MASVAPGLGLGAPFKVFYSNKICITSCVVVVLSILVSVFQTYKRESDKMIKL